MALTVVCGSRGQGKTTLLRQYAADAAGAGRTVGGIASPAVFEDEQRIGYDLLDLRDGSRRPLARVAASADETPTIGVYKFDAAALAAGNAAIIAAVQEGLDLIAIDEIGRLELDGGGWAPALTFALKACGPQQELIIAVRASLTEELTDRFSSPMWTSARRISPPDHEPNTRSSTSSRIAARRAGE
jgi:nucleoside-triphosphatase THEP1